MSKYFMRALWVSLTAVTLGCGDDSSNPTSPASAEPDISGDGQIGIVGSTLPDPLRVLVRDADGAPLDDVRVEWTITAGGGSLSGASSRTDDDGIAEVTLTLGTTPGVNQITATIEGIAPVRLTARATAGPVDTLVIMPLDTEQPVGVGRVIALEAAPADVHGNPIDETVTWRSSDTTIARVNAAGLVSGIAPGSASIEATLGGVTGTYALTVTTDGAAYIPLVSLDAGGGSVVGYTCSADSLGAGSCWGWNGGGGHGTGNVLLHDLPTPITQGGGLLFRQVSVGNGDPSQFSCGLTEASRLFCWGTSGGYGIGHATTMQSNTPIAVMPDSTFQFLHAGRQTSCAITAAGKVLCWGRGSSGRLGTGNATHSAVPVAAATPAGVSFTGVALGTASTCAIATTGSVYCWGFNSDGAVGDGTFNNALSPVLAQLPGGVQATRIAASGWHTCAVTNTNALYCWGLNSSGQVGSGARTDAETLPVAAVLPSGVGAVEVAAGEEHTCILGTNGGVYCWGGNTTGQLGDGTRENRLAAVRALIPSGVTIQSITAGGAHTCALSARGEAFCWGRNAHGQLGVGGFTDVTHPVLVRR